MIEATVNALVRENTRKELLLIWITLICGVFSVAWFIAIPLAAAGLWLCSWPLYAALLQRIRRVGAEREFAITLVYTVFDSIVAIAAAYVLGLATRWLWLSLSPE